MSSLSCSALSRRHERLIVATSLRRSCRSNGGTLLYHRAISTTAHLRFKDEKAWITKNPAPGLGLSRVRGYKETLQLPSTTFDLRAHAQKREPLFRKKTTIDLYNWQAAQTDRPLFVLHDGPPYANGSIHMGHAINKICKDVINRQQVLMGKRVHYHPGWDCHGLPIENKIYGFPEAQGFTARTAPPSTVRMLGRRVANEAIAEQTDTFKTFALMTDWSKETTYRTNDTDYVKRQLRVMREMVRRGLIYRANRPVFWSPSSKSAIAEAEVEYLDTFMSRTVYVRFPLRPGAALLKAAESEGNEEALSIVRKASRLGTGLNLIIWTTTPWTLPSNMAVNVNPKMAYSLVVAESGPCKGEVMIMASERLPRLEKLKIGLNTTAASERPLLGPLKVLMTFEGSALLDAMYRHPYLPHEEQDRPIIGAPYVTAEQGTGIVHSAPGHGKEDYSTWQDFCKQPGNEQYGKEPILSPVDDHSNFTEQVRQLADPVRFLIRGKSRFDPDLVEDGNLAGLPVASAGSSSVIRTLHYTGDMLTEIHLHHRFPHDWRSKKPIIVRCTSQWFANLEPIKDKALEALKSVKFTPASGRARLETLIKSRGEWCISRQRVWGVPIPVVYNAETDEPLMSQENMEHIENVLTEKGVDHWWIGDADEFVAPSERKEGVTWRKGDDIVDVWFDSGTSWSQLPGVKELFNDTTASKSLQVPDRPVADVYFEGPDQHRGWFQSSLLTYIALGSGVGDGDGQAAAAVAPATVSAPYKNVFTHGFLTNRRHEKLSKSNEGISLKKPSYYIDGGHKRNEPAFGADAVRVWATRGDPQTDVILSALAVKHSSEALIKIRTTLRYLLSVLPPPGQGPRLEEHQESFGLMERYILDELFRFDEACRKAYEEFDFAQVMRRLSEFSNSVLSNYYYDISKDILYSDPVHSARRQATLAIMDHILRTMLSVVAPIAPHLAEEVWYYFQGATQDPTPEQAEQDSSPEDPRSFFQQGWQRVPERFRDEEAEREIKDLLTFRTSLLATLEQGRQSKVLTSSLGVDVDVLLGPVQSPEGETTPTSTPDLDRIRSVMRKHAAALPDLYLLGQINLLERWPTPEQETRPSPEWVMHGEHHDIPFILRPAIKSRCPRCWQHRREAEDALCKRCQQAVPHLSHAPPPPAPNAAQQQANTIVQ